jgi:uncharacterized membrane protein required for colicin V production
MGFIIDVILVVILAFCVWRGYKNGLIRGVCGFLALVLSIFGASLVASTYSEEYTGMLRPFVGGIVDSTLADILRPDGADAAGAPPAAEGGTYNTAFAALRKLGLSASAAELLAEKVSGAVADAEKGLASVITDKLCAALAYIVVFGAAFIILAIIFAVLGNLLNFVFSLPGLHLVDTVAGLAFGLGKGLIIVFFIALVLRYLGIVTSEAIEDTTLLKLLINHNPIANVLGI